MPTLGVCAGMQSINVLHGGGLLQHIPDLVGNHIHTKNNGEEPYSPVIPVEIIVDSSVGKAAQVNLLYTPSTPPPKSTVIKDNGFHHQAIDPDMVGNGLKIVAFSDNFTNINGEQRRLPEAIEPDPNGPLLRTGQCVACNGILNLVPALLPLILLLIQLSKQH